MVTTVASRTGFLYYQYNIYTTYYSCRVAPAPARRAEAPRCFVPAAARSASVQRLHLHLQLYSCTVCLIKDTTHAHADARQGEARAAKPSLEVGEREARHLVQGRSYSCTAVVVRLRGSRWSAQARSVRVLSLRYCGRTLVSVAHVLVSQVSLSSQVIFRDKCQISILK